MPNRYSDSLDGYGPDRATFGFIFKWWVWLLALVVVLAVVMVPVSLGLGWFNRGAQIISPENVSAQYQQGYDYYNALKGTAQNACTLEGVINTLPPGSEAYNQRQSQLIAQQQLYETNSRKYNAFMADTFRAKYVKPADLPSVAPTMTAMEAQVCTR